MSSDSQLTDRTLPGRDRVLANVKQIVAEQMGMTSEQLREQDALIEDIGCDSLDVIEITMEVEEHFDITVPEDRAQQIRTVGDVADGVLQCLGHGE
jgi:acyl carrier protein